MEAMEILNDRGALVRMIEQVARKFDPNIRWMGEGTVLSSTAFGGITGWLNREVLVDGQSFTYELGMPLRKLLDQLRPPD